MPHIVLLVDFLCACGICASRPIRRINVWERHAQRVSEVNKPMIVWSGASRRQNKRMFSCLSSLSSPLLSSLDQRSLETSICIYLAETELLAGVKGSAALVCVVLFSVCNVNVNNLLSCLCVLLWFCVQWRSLPADFPLFPGRCGYRLIFHKCHWGLRILI